MTKKRAEYLRRAIAIETKKYGIKVERWRDSNRSAGIAFQTEKHGRLVFENHADGFGTEYEAALRELIDALEEIVNDPCNLPRL